MEFSRGFNRERCFLSIHYFNSATWGNFIIPFCCFSCLAGSNYSRSSLSYLPETRSGKESVAQLNAWPLLTIGRLFVIRVGESPWSSANPDHVNNWPRWYEQNNYRTRATRFPSRPTWTVARVSSMIGFESKAKLNRDAKEKKRNFDEFENGNDREKLGLEITRLARG